MTQPERGEVLVDDVSRLAPLPQRVVVINVGTDLVTTRAVLSALTHTAGRVLLVNCDPTTHSRDRFGALASVHDRLDVVEAPLKLHGETLDWLFTVLADEQLLLLDSDAELRDGAFVEWMTELVHHRSVFGAGFVQGPNEVPEHWSRPAGSVVYAERPWIPCALFDAVAVRSAMAAGRSFLPRYVPNEFGSHRRLSNFLAARWGPPWAPHSQKFERLPGVVRDRLRTARLDWLRFARDRYYFSLRPSMVFYDTGADVYEHLRFERELRFAGLPVEVLRDQVHHYSGVSRFAVAGRVVDDVDEALVHDEVVTRLRDAYGHAWRDGDAGRGLSAAATEPVVAAARTSDRQDRPRP
jgi:hypothetical protein